MDLLWWSGGCSHCGLIGLVFALAIGRFFVSGKLKQLAWTARVVLTFALATGASPPSRIKRAWAKQHPPSSALNKDR